MQNIHGNIQGVVHVQGPHTVVIGLSNGAILRLEVEILGDNSNGGE